MSFISSGNFSTPAVFAFTSLIPEAGATPADAIGNEDQEVYLADLIPPKNKSKLEIRQQYLTFQFVQRNHGFTCKTYKIVSKIQGKCNQWCIS